MINAMSGIGCFLEKLRTFRFAVILYVIRCFIVKKFTSFMKRNMLLYQHDQKYKIIILKCFLLNKYIFYTKHSISLKFAAILEFRHFKNFRHQLFLYAGSENDPHEPL